MEGGDLLYVIMLILYGLYSVFFGGDKKKKKAAPPPSTPTVSPRKKRKRKKYIPEEVETSRRVEVKPNQRRQKTPEEFKREIEAKFKKLEEASKRREAQEREQRAREIARTPHNDPDCVPPLEPVYEEELSDEFIPERIEQTKYFDYDHQRVERHNLDDSPKTHKEDVHFKKRKRKKGITIGKNFKFNAKEAVIYKEIMERKYF